MSMGKMEATAITTIAFIFAASAITVLITICYKGINGTTGSHYKKRHHRKIAVSSSRKINHDVETGDGEVPDIVENLAAAPVEASIVMCGSGGAGGGAAAGVGGGGAVVVTVEMIVK
ncbi:hypothetical protein L1987_26730 [Smallanthus sonchifolius]|uniref:Uncharacterized protein n=1 Tax=Smallanthus sonchifolius TaxID=185202 RepID=A0ACB9IA40_9ASTR|nr:hypothetical protein L1987_26730 [Smallanthus sonchifolius]